MRRGSIVALRPARLLPTFRFDCLYRPTWLRLYANHLRGLGLPLPAAALSERWQRWSGDGLDLGRGEILMLETQA
jgi:formylmethanofuran dehydrogenase subunit C